MTASQRKPRAIAAVRERASLVAGPAGDDEGDEPRAPLSVLMLAARAGCGALMSAALLSAPERFSLRWVGSLSEARAALIDHAYECLLVDLELPGTRGLELVEALRDGAPDAAIVSFSNQSDIGLGVPALARSSDDCLLNSEMTPRQIRRCIEQVVESKRAQQLVRQLSDRSATILAAVEDAVLVLDASGRVESANPAAAALLRTPTHDLVGHRVLQDGWEVLDRHGKVLAHAEQPALTTLRTGEPLSGVINALRGADGKEVWVETRTSPLHARDGVIDGVVLSLRAIGEPTAAAQAEHLQTALLGSIGESVVVTDPRGRIVFWNTAAERMHGWAQAEVLGRLAVELVGAEASSQAQQISLALAKREGWTGDCVLHRRDGGSFDALVTVTPVFDDKGQMIAVVALSSDVTERKDVEDTARAMAAIVESSADAIFTKSVEGVILTWNRGAEELYGYTTEEVIGRHVSLLDPQQAATESASILAALAAGETVRGLETVLHHRDGTGIEVSLTVSPIVGADGSVVAASVIARDTSDRRRLERELIEQATLDVLTGLPNRTLLADRLAHSLARSSRRKSPVAVLFLDLDHFKAVNDASGHLAGDSLLVQVAAGLREVTRPSDTIARFGGDEFVIVCEDADEAAAEALADRIAERLRDPIEVDGHAIHVTVSIGIAVSPPLKPDQDALMRHADAAMYQAKAQGRARWRVFDAAMAEESSQALELTDELREALTAGRLEVHYQPVIDLITDELIGLEALARWHHATRGWIPPAVFVPLAEAGGFVSAMDRAIMAQACSDVSALRARGVFPDGARLAVNISPHAITEPDLIDLTRETARRARLPLDDLEFEVTETGIMTDTAAARTVLTTLRKLGVGVALDDFGTGYSSLTNVRQLPVTTLKIDQSFVRNIATRPDDLAVATSVVELGKAIGLRTVAEGIETSEQLALLRRLGCQAGQGYLWSKALPRDELAELLKGQPGHIFAATIPQPRTPTSAPPVVNNEHGLHRIVELHRSGCSAASIAAALNADGFHTPRGMRWNTGSITRVVRTLGEDTEGLALARKAEH